MCASRTNKLNLIQKHRHFDNGYYENNNKTSLFRRATVFRFKKTTHI